MTTLASDNFNRANAFDDLGALWDVMPEMFALSIFNNTAQGNHDPSIESYNGVTWPNDQWSQCTIVTQTTGGDAVGVAVRCSTSVSSAGYIGYSSTAGTEIQRITAGQTFVQLGSTGAAASIGDVLRLEIVGSSLTLKVNGVARVTATDGTHASGRAGIIATQGDIDPQLDDWSGGDFASDAAVFQIPWKDPSFSR